MTDSTREFPLDMIVSYLMNGPYEASSSGKRIGCRWEQLEMFLAEGSDLKGFKGFDPRANLAREALEFQLPGVAKLGKNYPYLEVQQMAMAGQWNKDDPSDPEVASRFYREVYARATGKPAPETVSLKTYAAAKVEAEKGAAMFRAMGAALDTMEDNQRRGQGHRRYGIV